MVVPERDLDGRSLEALLGPDAPGLSATTVVRLKEVWRREYEAWSKRGLSGQRFVYIWADGIYSNVRLDDERQCLLVVMGAQTAARLLAVHDGFRESELSASCSRTRTAGASCRRSWRWATARWVLGGLAEGLSSNPGAALCSTSGQRAQ